MLEIDGIDGFANLVYVVRNLIGEGGCPWDSVQTPNTLRRYMVEECFEAVDAIASGDSQHVKEELGDLFFNVLLDACIYERNGDFTVDDCLRSIAEKLVRRHPHVFSASAGSSEMDADLDKQWERIKENVEGRKEKFSLDAVPDGFPPLLKATKMLKKAAKKGFEWRSADEVRSKVLEELSEVDEAAGTLSGMTFASDSGNINEAEAKRLDSIEFAHLEEEFGDLLLSVVNYARYLGVDASLAMEKANRKFKKRFDFVEESMKSKSLPMDDKHLEEMMDFWNEAKKE